MCALDHYLEDEGLSTLVIALVPQHARAMQPPRALLVPFELGRPLGAPEDPSFQRQVLEALFALLENTKPGSYLAEFQQDPPAAQTHGSTNNEGWACPVNFAMPAADDDATQGVQQEISSLQPWFDRAKQRRGRTATGTSSLDIAQVLTLLTNIHDGVEPVVATPTEMAFGDFFKLAAEDLKMFYAEAAMEQPNPGSSQALQHWFWTETQAGALLLALADRCTDHADPVVKAHARFTLVPAQRLAKHRAKDRADQTG